MFLMGTNLPTPSTTRLCSSPSSRRRFEPAGRNQSASTPFRHRVNRMSQLRRQFRRRPTVRDQAIRQRDVGGVPWIRLTGKIQDHRGRPAAQARRLIERMRVDDVGRRAPARNLAPRRPAEPLFIQVQAHPSSIGRNRVCAGRCRPSHGGKASEESCA